MSAGAVGSAGAAAGIASGRRSAAGPAGVRIRPMAAADVAGAAAAAAAAFDFSIEDPAVRERWALRTGHPLCTDPGGSFVAVRGDEVVGVATGIRRPPGLWVLSHLAVTPGLHGVGAGRALLDAAIGYAGPDDAGLIVASNDAAAIRLYGQAGFRLLPTFESSGVRDPARVAPDPAVTRLAPDEIGRFDDLSVRVRGASYLPEMSVLSRGEIYGLDDRGFVIVTPEAHVDSLIAADEDAAARLLRHALHRVGESGYAVRWITAAQQWAVDVVLAAGYGLRAYGALCVRDEPGTLTPFLPSGSFA